MNQTTKDAIADIAVRLQQLSEKLWHCPSKEVEAMAIELQDLLLSENSTACKLTD